MKRALVLLTLLSAGGCTKDKPAAATPVTTPTCDPLWSRVLPAEGAKGTGSVALEDGVLVLEGSGALDPCFTDGCTGSNGRLRLSQDHLEGDFDATAVVDSLVGGDADLVFFVQSETGRQVAMLRIGQEGGHYGVGLDLMGGDKTRSLVDKTSEGSARLRVQRMGTELTLTGTGTEGGEVTATTTFAGPVRVGLGWSTFQTGKPVTARVSAVEAEGAVKPDSFDCPRFLVQAAAK